MTFAVWLIAFATAAGYVYDGVAQKRSMGLARSALINTGLEPGVKTSLPDG